MVQKAEEEMKWGWRGGRGQKRQDTWCWEVDWEWDGRDGEGLGDSQN